MTSENLTSRQRAAIPKLLESRDLGAAAESIGINRKTLWRWMQQDAFKVELQEAEALLIDTAARRLAALSAKALDQLEAILDDDAAPPSVKRMAATSILDQTIKIRDLRLSEIRLGELERKVLIEVVRVDER